MSAPSRDRNKFNLRLPAGMRDELAAHARAQGRSCNAEIIARLQSSFTSERIRVDLRLPTETLRMLGEIATAKGLSLDGAVEEALRATLPAIKRCGFCGDAGTVDDQNWQPEAYSSGDMKQRKLGAGLLRCICSAGDHA